MGCDVDGWPIWEILNRRSNGVRKKMVLHSVDKI